MTGHDRLTEGRDCRHDAAAYVLGALEPMESRDYKRHLEDCAICRDEVAALAPVLDALPLSGGPHPVPPALRRRVLRAVRAEPRARIARSPRTPLRNFRSAPALLRFSLGGCLTLVLATATVATVQLGSPGSGSRVIAASLGRAQLRVADGHGELIVAHLPPLPADRVYELWLQAGRQPLAPSTLFAVTSRGTADIGVPTDLRGVMRVLVTVEPKGGSLVPTTRAVIVERLT
jgi:anti-sigma-K factor RskA